MQTVSTPFTKEPDWKAIVDRLRDALKRGFTIRAIDPDGMVLEALPDGCVHGGLCFELPRERHHHVPSANWTLGDISNLRSFGEPVHAA